MFGLPRKPDAGKAPPGDRSAGGPGAAPSNVVALPTRNAEGVLRRLEWTVLRRLDGLLHGDYRTLFRGFGLDLPLALQNAAACGRSTHPRRNQISQPRSPLRHLPSAKLPEVDPTTTPLRVFS